MSKAHEGLRVLDLSETIGGQFCSRMLADFGAEVLLIEPPGGSKIRRLRAEFARVEEIDSSALFWHLNTGKKSVMIDWETDHGKQTLQELLESADVAIVDSDIDGVGLSIDNSGLIVCTISDFGRDGAFAGWAANEMIHWALAGTMFVSGDHDKKPLYGLGYRAYYASGVAAYISIMAALMERAKSGMGQNVEVTVAETAAAMGQIFATQYAYSGTFPMRGRYSSPLSLIRCRDGWVIVFGLRRWPAIAEAFDILEYLDDPRFSTVGARIENWTEIDRMLTEKASQLSADEIVARAQAGRASVSKIMTLDDLWDCPHLNERGFWHHVHVGDRDRPVLGPPFILSKTPWCVQGPAPRPGEHSSGKPPTNWP